MKHMGAAPRGVALIAVLWLVAAMSLITAGIVQSVRSEIRAVGLQRQSVIAGALADAAILLALQNLNTRLQEPLATVQSIPVQFEGSQYKVVVEPLNGLIDINRASPLLLADLYRYAGGLNADFAQALAQATVDTRQRKNAKGTAQGFEAVEDLFSVPQMTYGLYARLVGLVTTDLKDSSGRVNPLAAPLSVLQVLAGGDKARAFDLAAKRDLNPNVMDTSFLKPEHIAMASTRSLRIKVNIGLLDGAEVDKEWRVYWGMDPRSGLPWRVLGSLKSVKQSPQVGN